MPNQLTKARRSHWTLHRFDYTIFTYTTTCLKAVIRGPNYIQTSDKGSVYRAVFFTLRKT